MANSIYCNNQLSINVIKDHKVVDPYLEGWNFETKTLNIDIHPTGLLFTITSEGYIIG